VILVTTTALSAILVYVVLFRSTLNRPRNNTSPIGDGTSVRPVRLTGEEMNDERILIEEARRLLVSSGDAQKDVVQAMNALAALVSAVRIRDGDAAAGALLEKGRALFQEREGTDAERSEAMFSLGEEGSLLKERGAEDILCDAFADGSSVLCRKCTGLVSRARWNAHKTKWCPAIMSEHDVVEEEDEEEEDDRMDVE